MRIFLLMLAGCELTIDLSKDDSTSTEIVTDYDGDGYSEEEGDCVDTNPDIHPGAEEICDGFDNDCFAGTLMYHVDGSVDEDGDGYGTGVVIMFWEVCVLPDGYVSNNVDCDDTDPTTYLGATEVCDGIDNSCDGHIDEGCSDTVPPPQ